MATETQNRPTNIQELLTDIDQLKSESTKRLEHAASVIEALKREEGNYIRRVCALCEDLHLQIRSLRAGALQAAAGVVGTEGAAIRGFIQEAATSRDRLERSEQDLLQRSENDPQHHHGDDRHDAAVRAARLALSGLETRSTADTVHSTLESLYGRLRQDLSGIVTHAGASVTHDGSRLCALPNTSRELEENVFYDVTDEQDIRAGHQTGSCQLSRAVSDTSGYSSLSSGSIADKSVQTRPLSLPLQPAHFSTATEGERSKVKGCMHRSKSANTLTSTDFTTSGLQNRESPITVEQPESVVHRKGDKKNGPIINTPKSDTKFELKSVFYSKYHKDPCFLTGIAACEDGKVIVCDFLHAVVQLFSSEFLLLDKQKCSEPWGVCATTRNSVAVSQYSYNKIQLFSVDGNALRKTESFKIGSNSFLYDLCFCSGMLYILCHGGCVLVTDLHGNQLATIRTDDTLGSDGYLAIDSVRNHVIISGGSHVTSVNDSGGVVWRYPRAATDKTFTPRGVQKRGDVLYVADNRSGRVVVLSLEDGAFIRVLVEGGLDCPQALCLSSTRQSVYVLRFAYNASESRAVRVFSAL